ncbi:VOC family protein [Actinoplanes missouriensis]|uniref:VOC family protein n=1 Tax=Actinoplanes missouriensis TaxID=1866 RepID=UPI00340ABCCE
MSLKIAQIVIDCADAQKLAAFWSQALDRPVDPGATADFATIGHGAATSGSAPALMFIKVPEPKNTKNRLHFDLAARPAPNWQSEVDRLLTLGATRVDEHQAFGWHWITMRDPEGNEFDLGPAATTP